LRKLYVIRLGDEVITATMTSEEGEVIEWLENKLFHQLGVTRFGGTWDEVYANRSLVFGNKGGVLESPAIMVGSTIMVD